MKKSALVLAVTIALGGCSMNQTVPPADANIPPQWSENEVTFTVPILSWSQIFTSPIIAQDLRFAKEHNKEIKKASLNAIRAHQLINAAGTPMTASLSANSLINVDECCDISSESFGLLDVSFELDVWGRIRSATQVAEFAAQAADITLEGVHSAIQAEVIRAHLSIAYVNESLAVLDEMERVLEFLEMQARNRTTAGLTQSAELSRLLLKRSGILSLRNQLNQQRSSSIEALKILTSYSRRESEYAQVVADLRPSSTGVPKSTSSTILLNRPDVRAAEKQLLAVNANIGVARAERFPKIELPILGFLLEGGALNLDILPSITQVLFDGGRLKALEEAAITSRDIALVDYELTIQRAFRDMANALSNAETTSRQVSLANESQELAQEGFNRTLRRHDSGYDNLGDLIDRYDELLAANIQVPVANYGQVLNTTQLFAAIGTKG
jgi:multidrug efflux system outer membrane protein